MTDAIVLPSQLGQSAATVITLATRLGLINQLSDFASVIAAGRRTAAVSSTGAAVWISASVSAAVTGSAVVRINASGSVASSTRSGTGTSTSSAAIASTAVVWISASVSAAVSSSAVVRINTSGSVASSGGAAALSWATAAVAAAWINAARLHELTLIVVDVAMARPNDFRLAARGLECWGTVATLGCPAPDVVAGLGIATHSNNGDQGGNCSDRLHKSNVSFLRD